VRCVVRFGRPSSVATSVVVVLASPRERSYSNARSGVSPEWVAERVGHSDGGALALRRYRHLYPSESYVAAPSLDALVAERG
jgi:hypothetical protein